MDLTLLQLGALNDCFFQWPAIVAPDLRDTDKFAHYTSASVAMSIIKGQSDDKRCLWLRNATLMNDFSEVEYGQWVLRHTLADLDISARLKKVCADIHPELIYMFGQMDEEARYIKANTFLLSLALHRDKELSQGKLSMWRAYGGNANVCILLEPGPFIREQTAYDVNISPVDYKGVDSFKAAFDKMFEGMEKHREELKAIDLETLKLNFKIGIDNMVLSSKHPGFEEENEWRIIKRREVWPKADLTPSQVVDVRGVMQEVFYLPMKNIEDKGVIGSSLDEILFRLIIGPTENPDLVRSAFTRALGEAGVEAPHDRVLTCGIPLRR
jgi:hypothetical protein